jgi:hypothetical protein
MEQVTGTGVGRWDVAVLGKPATIDMLSWYLRHHGIDAYGFREVSTTRLLGISVAAVVIFLDDFPRGIVDDAVSRIRRVQPHIAMVVVCESLAPYPLVPNSVVIGKDRWRSSILDVLLSCIGRRAR